MLTNWASDERQSVGRVDEDDELSEMVDLEHPNVKRLESEAQAIGRLQFGVAR